MMSVREPPAPYRSTGRELHGGGAISWAIGMHSAGSVPPRRCWSPNGITITSPAVAQCRSPSPSVIQHDPEAMMWNTMSRSLPGRNVFAKSAGSGDS